MVTLTINPSRGNHARFFPHSGYLGLSPVVVSGTLHTRVEEDRQPIEASKVVIRLRCYEAAGLASAARPDQQNLPHTSPKSPVNVLWQTERTLWVAASPAGEPYLPLGDADWAWRLVIPTQAVEPVKGGHAVGSITYKTWRTWWQVEAVVYHKPAGMMGSKLIKSHGLFLNNFGRTQTGGRMGDIGGGVAGATSTLQSAAGRVGYTLSAPAGVCCGDAARVGFGIQAGPAEEGMVLKRLSVALVRTLALVEQSPDGGVEPEPKRWKLRRPAHQSGRAYPSSRQMTTLSTTLVEAEALPRPVLLGPSARYDDALLLRVPLPKSRSHYSIGESCKTRIAIVSYAFVFKLTIKTKSGGVEKMDLSALEVKLSGVSNQDFRQAVEHLELLRVGLPSVARLGPPSDLFVDGSGKEHHRKQLQQHQGRRASKGGDGDQDCN